MKRLVAVFALMGVIALVSALPVVAEKGTTLNGTPGQRDVASTAAKASKIPAQTGLVHAAINSDGTVA